MEDTGSKEQCDMVVCAAEKGRHRALSVEKGLYFRVVLIEKVGGKIVDDEEIHGKSVPGREKSSAKALRRECCWHVAGTAGRPAGVRGAECKVNSENLEGAV